MRIYKKRQENPCYEYDKLLTFVISKHQSVYYTSFQFFCKHTRQSQNQIPLPTYKIFRGRLRS